MRSLLSSLDDHDYANDLDLLFWNPHAEKDVKAIIHWQDGGTDGDIKARLRKARGTFINLKNIWKFKYISRNTKIRLYNSCVIHVPCSAVVWCGLLEDDRERLSSFHNGYLRRILRIIWPAKIFNENLLNRAIFSDMRFSLKKYHLRWVGLQKIGGSKAD